MRTIETPSSATPADSKSPTLESLYAVIRAATRTPDDWQNVADGVADVLTETLPSANEVLRSIPAFARGGCDRSQILHVEPDGSFSVAALISRPGQATSVHDHTTWAVVAVVAGAEYEEWFSLDEGSQTLTLTGTRTDRAGAVSGFSPPGDIHRVSNPGPTVGVSLHVYGTDLGRIGSSVRRTYDLPINTTNED